MELKVNLTDMDYEMLCTLRDAANELIMLKKHTRVPLVLLSNNEAARLLGMNPTYISTLIRKKKLGRVTIGESRGIPLKDVMKLKTRREPEEPKKL